MWLRESEERLSRNARDRSSPPEMLSHARLPETQQGALAKKDTTGNADGVSRFNAFARNVPVIVTHAAGTT
jgi:hypothetical protein